MGEAVTVLTAKVPTEMAKELARVAQRQSVSKSELVREAIGDLLSRRRQSKKPSALDLAGDLVGCVTDAPADLLTNPAHMADYGK